MESLEGNFRDLGTRSFMQCLKVSKEQNKQDSLCNSLSSSDQFESGMLLNLYITWEWQIETRPCIFPICFSTLRILHQSQANGKDMNGIQLPDHFTLELCDEYYAIVRIRFLHWIAHCSVKHLLLRIIQTKIGKSALCDWDMNLRLKVLFLHTTCTDSA